ncbi:MAG: histidine--tRNA ligase [Fimbriimonadaceae bacterium]|nr:histidine--tRNA ligase [Fimbriimonadaceae bacterium]
MRYQRPRGTEDILPDRSWLWRSLENEFFALTAQYGYGEIRTPTFEDYELFVRTSGDSSEVVNKQMYDFHDKGDRHIALKPEGTAPVVRAWLEAKVSLPGSLTRYAYATPVFRHERPQKGRLREPHQFGLELLGATSPLADAEIIEIVVRFYELIGIGKTTVLLNSIGRSETRARYREIILNHVSAWMKDQSTENQERAAKNPLRLLDTKDEELRRALVGIPTIASVLEDESRAHFDRLQKTLNERSISFVLQADIVRGLDYYSDTVFEVHSDQLGAQGALCGGGRYDGLVEAIGGPSTPAVGVGMGIERAIIVLDALNKVASPPRMDAFVVSADDESWAEVIRLVSELRDEGFSTTFDLDQRGMKQQIKQADRSGARFAVIIGASERASGSATVKNLDSGDQTSISFSDLARYLS